MAEHDQQNLIELDGNRSSDTLFEVLSDYNTLKHTLSTCHISTIFYNIVQSWRLMEKQQKRVPVKNMNRELFC